MAKVVPFNQFQEPKIAVKVDSPFPGGTHHHSGPLHCDERVRATAIKERKTP
jgi:hypothetical protein